MKQKSRMLWRSILVWMIFGIMRLAATEPVPFTDISPEQALAMINSTDLTPKLTVVDVRRPEEFNQGYIRGALHIEVTAADFSEKIAKLDKKGAFLVYCRGGVRSARAMVTMRELGFELVYNLGGGILRWQAEKLPLQQNKPEVAEPQDCSTNQTAAASHSWNRDRKTTTIPFRLRGDHIHIDAVIDGTKLDLILDTGMPAPGVLLLGGEEVQKLKLNYVGEALIGGAGGKTTPAQIADGVTIQIGDLILKEQRAIVKTAEMTPQEKAPIETNLGTNGVIGNALFNPFMVGIDYDTMTVTLSEHGSLIAAEKGDVVPLIFDSPFPMVDIEVEQMTGEKMSLRMVLDIGAFHALSLNLEANPKIKVPEKTIDFIGSGAGGGETKGKMGRIKSLRLGAFTLQNVLASFYDKKLAAIEIDGNLGNGFMSRFNLTFDYVNKRVHLLPNKTFADPFETGMSGFLADKTSAGIFAVKLVRPDSPAADAGLAVNDRIVAVNGIPAGKMTNDELHKASGILGGRLELVIERDGKRQKMALVLRRLI